MVQNKKPKSRNATATNLWRRHQRALVQISKSSHLASGHFIEAVREITALAAKSLQVERVSVWFYEHERSQIRCLDLFELSKKAHTAGLTLKEDDYPHYFKALTNNRLIVANNAQHHPTTREFTKDYLKPLGITSMIDAPIRLGGEIAGIVCHEHVGKMRKWKTDEQHFAGSIADMVALALEAKQKAKAEAALRESEGRFMVEMQRAHEELEQRFALRTSELKTTHQQLVHSEKLAAIGKLSASIAHEINNPLFGIRNVLERVSEHSSIDPTTKQLAEMAKKECNRISEFIRNLQDFYRPSSGVVERVDVHQVIQEILLLFSKKFKSRHITINTQFAAQSPWIMGVGDQIKQVLLNLLSNAEDAISENGGEILIKTEIGNGLVKIRIKDSGCGIAEEALPMIFEPFYTTKTTGKGTGLGLAISSGIIRQHRGAIRVESQINNGTTFTIQLPLAGAQA